jgi:hypothetical protein
VFQSGFTNSTQCVDIAVVDDAILESSEFFNIILSSSDPDVDIENSMASIVIIDNDGIPVFLKFYAPNSIPVLCIIRGHCELQ